MVQTAEKAATASPIRIRPLAGGDIDRIARIESLSSPAPWTREIFRGCLRPDYLCLGLETRGQVAGFAIANAAAGEGHLLNIAIDPEYRRLGLGTLLLRTVLARLARCSARTVFLEVRCSNAPAIALYRRFGFEDIGIRKNYYARDEASEDALTMKLELES